ncbi:hypothetical protein A2U01_0059756, partial [Trifolium medium]|nr:hypothetical protein [Trifolium medium]
SGLKLKVTGMWSSNCRVPYGLLKPPLMGMKRKPFV